MSDGVGKEAEGEEDYMSMVIVEPVAPKQKETYTQRRLRKEREAEINRPKSKAEVAAQAEAARDDALEQPLHAAAPSSKGLKMMQRMGYRTGGVLGKEGNQEARSEPLGVNIKEDRGGIGMVNERKRKFREEVGEVERKKLVDEGEFRERVAKEREEKRLEAMVGAAQKVAEKLDAEAEENDGQDAHGDDREKGENVDDDNNREVGTEQEQDGHERPHVHGRVKLLSQTNVLYRGLLRYRAEVERERRARYDLHQSLSRLPTYEDPHEDEEDKRAIGRENKQAVLEEEIDDDEDPELEEFRALPPSERLEKLVDYLRTTWRYCFWCKFQYPNAAMEGCPGKTEEDHD